MTNHPMVSSKKKMRSRFFSTIIVTNMEAQERDNASAWFVCVCCSLASLITMGTTYIYGLFFPFILDEFQAGKAATASVGSFAIAFLTVLGPVSSKLSERFGCRAVMVLSGLTCGAGALGSSFAPNIYVLFITYSIAFGFGCSLALFAAVQITPLYFDRYQSFAAATASGAGPGAGLLLMSAIARKLLQHFDWRKSLMILAAINLAPCILGCTIRRKRRKTENEEDSRQQDKKMNLCSRCMKSMGMSTLTDKSFLIACFSMAICCVGYAMPAIHLAKYVKHLGIQTSRSSWMYFTIGITSLVARLITGWLCDTGWIANIHIFQFAITVFGIADLLLPVMQIFEHFMVYSVTFGLCEGTFMTSMHCHILKSFPGMGFGWYMAIIGASFLVGPILAGLIADLSGSYSLAFITAGVLFLVSACLPFLSKFHSKTIKPEEIKLSDETDVLVIFEKMTVL